MNCQQCGKPIPLGHRKSCRRKYCSRDCFYSACTGAKFSELVKERMQVGNKKRIEGERTRHAERRQKPDMREQVMREYAAELREAAK